MGSNLSRFKGDDLPVERVSWRDCVEYCNRKSESEGLEKCYIIKEVFFSDSFIVDYGKNGYRLPTEAEWEYAAKGGNRSKGYKYSGDDNIGIVAEYEGNNDKSTKPVCGKQPNELGIYDMSGNVWEWCSDWYGKNYYSNGSSRNPKGPSSGSARVNRGGSWYDDASYCRAADRSRNTPSRRGNNLGFRLVLAVN